MDAVILASYGVSSEDKGAERSSTRPSSYAMTRPRLLSSPSAQKLVGGGWKRWRDMMRPVRDVPGKSTFVGVCGGGFEEKLIEA